jgi:hypothetical protein
MAKKKNTSAKSAPKKIVAKAAATKSPAQEAAAPGKSVAEKIATRVPVSEPHLLAVPVRTARPSPAQLYDEIRRRAYDFYSERGGEHGSHEADWHRAESEVRSKYK